MIRGENKTWTAWSATLAASLLLLFGGTAAFQIFMDPFDVWNSVRHWGVNNWKFAQWNNDRLFKNYQVQQNQYDVIIFGTSRAITGYPGYWPNTPAGKTYNYGLSGMHLPELESQVDFILSTQSPKTIVLALEPLMFSAQDSEPRPGYSRERMSVIRHSDMAHLAYKLRETVFTWTAIRSAVASLRGSRVLFDQQMFDRAGHACFRGRERGVIKDAYVLNTWNYLTYIYRGLSIAPGSYEGFERILGKIRKRGIDAVVLFNPLSSDYLFLLDINDKLDLVDTLKRKMVALTPVWDFAYVNSVTAKRRNFLDGAHFNDKVGRWVLDRVGGVRSGAPTDFGVLLTPSNIDGHLATAQSRYRRQRVADKALFRVMSTGARRENRRAFTKALSRIIKFDK